MKIVVDWDGTATEVDGLYEVVRSFGDVLIYDETEERLGELTLNDVIAVEIGTVRRPLSTVLDWMREHVHLRAGFTDFARRHRPLVVSSGFHELIAPVLDREGLELEVRANWLDPRPEGWRARFRSSEPCPVCGEPCKRADVAGLGEFVFIGDGYSDRCIALAATRVFARDGLADYLEERRHPFEVFEDFDGLAVALDGAAA